MKDPITALRMPVTLQSNNTEPGLEMSVYFLTLRYSLATAWDVSKILLGFELGILYFLFLYFWVREGTLVHTAGCSVFVGKSFFFRQASWAKCKTEVQKAEIYERHVLIQSTSCSIWTLLQGVVDAFVPTLALSLAKNRAIHQIWTHGSMFFFVFWACQTCHR